MHVWQDAADWVPWARIQKVTEHPFPTLCDIRQGNCQIPGSSSSDLFRTPIKQPLHGCNWPCIHTYVPCTVRLFLWLLGRMQSCEDAPGFEDLHFPAPELVLLGGDESLRTQTRDSESFGLDPHIE